MEYKQRANMVSMRFGLNWENCYSFVIHTHLMMKARTYFCFSFSYGKTTLTHCIDFPSPTHLLLKYWYKCFASVCLSSYTHSTKVSMQKTCRVISAALHYLTCSAKHINNLATAVEFARMGRTQPPQPCPTSHGFLKLFFLKL